MTAITTMLGLILAISAFAANSASIDSPAQREAAAIVQQLRDFPPWVGEIARSDGTIDPLEQRREELYERLRRLGDDALPALTRGLRDPDVRIRRNVALVLTVLAGKWYKPSEPRLNIRPCLSALIAALKDSDTSVRARAAHAIGDIGIDAAPAIPALLILLKNAEEGSRIGACIALRGIGPAAKQAMPALRQALDDPKVDVRRFAQQAIDSIQDRQNLPRRTSRWTRAEPAGLLSTTCP
jgi:HEAT repeat protein